MPAMGWIMIGGTAFAALAVAAEVWLYYRLHPLLPIVRAVPPAVPAKAVRVADLKVIPALPAARPEVGR
jgi:hypothetical protein